MMQSCIHWYQRPTELCKDSEVTWEVNEMAINRRGDKELLKLSFRVKMHTSKEKDAHAVYLFHPWQGAGGIIV